MKLQKSRPPFIVYKKLKFQNKKTKEIQYKYIQANKKLDFYDYKYFSDFIYTPGISQKNVLKIYEDFLIRDENEEESSRNLHQNKEDLKFIKDNFCDILPPSFFCKEFAWSNYNFDLEREEEVKLGKRKKNLKRKSNLVSQVSIKILEKNISIPKFLQKFDKKNPNVNLRSLRPQDLEIDGSPLSFFLKLLFKEKPVWTMSSLLKRVRLNRTLSSVSFFAVKKALSKFTYLFK